jgi:NAD(P)-dependent dehydrogenase (short-subunit alcohol dehydrogenase family)
VRRAAAEIIALDLPIVGLLNNAGIFPMRATKNALGWDKAFATNHIGPFVLTEALISHLPDDANVVFVASFVEGPERKPAKMAGFRGRPVHLSGGERTRRVGAGRIEDAARGRLCHIEAMHPCHGAGVWSRDSAVALQRGRTGIQSRPPASGAMPTSPALPGGIRPLDARSSHQVLEHPKRAARVITKALLNESGETGIYYDADGRPMFGSALVRDPKFQDRVVAETRALLSTIPK